MRRAACMLKINDCIEINFSPNDDTNGDIYVIIAYKKIL